MDADRPIRLLVVAPGPKARGRLRAALQEAPGVEVAGEAADLRGAALIAAGLRPDALLVAVPATEEAGWALPALLRMAPAVPVLLTPLELWFPEDGAGAPDVRRFAEILRLAWAGGATAPEGGDLAVLAHDIATPASSVVAISDMLLRYWDRFDEEERRQALANMGTLGRELARLVERLVRSGAEDRLVLVGEKRLSELPPVIRRAVDRVRSAAPDHRFSVRVDPDLPRVRIDPGAVSEAVENFLTNAVKHAPAGSVVRVAAAETDGEVQITVADEGPGIDPADRDRLFRRFSRIPGDPTAGHGLGLYIARTIAEGHGGRVWADGARGRGATFGLALPIPRGSRRGGRRRAHVAARH